MADSRARRANRLAYETSPYLLQHAENPVDWFPWGADALALAKSADRPILLSIGYAACHWCHVMERESFENPEIAKLMNEHFVCVKVDREERPDLDDIYMAATVAMNGSGGWPMTVFLTPDQRPFFAGTYFPPEDRFGRPGFKRLLAQVAAAWASEREQLAEQADLLTRHVRELSRPSEPLSVGRDAMSAACDALWADFDRHYGGFGSAPKFPPAATLSFLLRHYRQSADVRALEMAVGTLNGMKNGGMYDHIGGGFARYSTDERWLVPHFEKMLYDNAQLAHVYLEAYQVTGRAEYARVAGETLDYVMREMQGPDGGYFSATDADSEGEEGKFFVWSVDQVNQVLEPPDAERFCAFYDITEQGNWEGKNVLNTPRSLADVAKQLGIETAELAESLERAKPLMYRARLERVPPLLDDKVLTAHNGLMLGALAFGHQVLGEPGYLRSAERAADFLWQTLRRPDGGLFRTARAGTAHLPAYLEDYAYLTDGLISLYEAGGRSDILTRALGLAERMLRDFEDESGGAFYATAHDHEALIARTREGHDGALPNANSIAARALLRLGRHSGRDYLVERALGALRAYGRPMARLPRGFVSALSVVDQALEAPLELVTVGFHDDPDLQALTRVIASKYLPNRVRAHLEPDDAGKGDVSPLTRGKTLVDGKAAAYVCENFACRQPVTQAEHLEELLEAALQRQRSQRRAELGSRRLEGRATPEGTRRLAQRRRSEAESLTEIDYAPLADTGLWVSRLGFGAYRLSASRASHAEALRYALERGVNLIDTASSYTDGDSERVIGQSLQVLSERKLIQRDELVVVTKLGYARGATLAECALREQQGRPWPEMVKVSQELWHSIHPEFLEQELDRSLARLGLGTLDVCLLHNPEYFFEVDSELPLAERRASFYQRLERAFGFLERAVAAGKVGVYGVSSNTLVRPSDDPRATDLASIWQAARRVAGSEHHFRVIELPMNLAEPAGFALENTGTPLRSPLAFAGEHGLGVLTNRPLSAFVEGGLMRLVDPAPGDPATAHSGDQAAELGETLERMSALEHEFAQKLAPLLQAPEGALPPTALFAWASKLAQVAPALVSTTQYEELEQRVVLPQIEQATRSLDRAFGRSHSAWSSFRDEYLQQLEQALASIRQRAVERTHHTLSELRKVLQPHLAPGSETIPFSRLAVAAVRQLPGVSAVLVGMLEKAYVDDAIASLRLAPLTATAQGFQALFSQSRDGEWKNKDQTADRGSAT